MLEEIFRDTTKDELYAMMEMFLAESNSIPSSIRKYMLIWRGPESGYDNSGAEAARDLGVKARMESSFPLLLQTLQRVGLLHDAYRNLLVGAAAAPAERSALMYSETNIRSATPSDYLRPHTDYGAVACHSNLFGNGLVVYGRVRNDQVWNSGEFPINGWTPGRSHIFDFAERTFRETMRSVPEGHTVCFALGRPDVYLGRPVVYGGVVHSGPKSIDRPRLGMTTTYVKASAELPSCAGADVASEGAPSP